MIDHTLKRLRYLCDIIPSLLSSLDEALFSARPVPGKWSKKEIIGHLVDSAANNHQRFVRGQFEDQPAVSYNQDKWVAYGSYQQMDGKIIINLWSAYNRMLLELIRNIPQENLQLTCMTNSESQTLEFLVNDYVAHIEHHLHQVVDY